MIDRQSEPVGSTPLTPKARPGARTLARTAFGAVLLAAVVVATPPSDPVGGVRNRTSSSAVLAPLVGVAASDARILVDLLDNAWAATTGEGSVPSLALESFPAGLDLLDSGSRKDTFIRALLPHVLHANELILAQRRTLGRIQGEMERGVSLPARDLVFLRDTAATYRMDEELEELRAEDAPAFIRSLLARVDVIPPSLVLAQAAKESAWGTSRFVLEGNNLFGQRVFTPGKGMAPLDADPEARFSVARYPTLGASVAAYMTNLNSLWAYEELRVIRAQMRAESRDIDSERLAHGLSRYSIQSDVYVAELIELIRHNRLKRFDRMRLFPVGIDWVREHLGASPSVGAIIDPTNAPGA